MVRTRFNLYLPCSKPDISRRAILHDENTFPDAEKFVPERFLIAEGELDPNAPDITASFGYGRRMCPGMYMASDSLWLTAANLVWAFDIGKPIAADGRVVEPTGEYTFGLVRYAAHVRCVSLTITHRFPSYPAPFKCTFNLRSEKVSELIHAANEE